MSRQRIEMVRSAPWNSAKRDLVRSGGVRGAALDSSCRHPAEYQPFVATLPDRGRFSRTMPEDAR